MTQTDAVVKALELLGGRGKLRWIYLLAKQVDKAAWSDTKDPNANIRRIVRTTPKQILPLEHGEYELVGYHTEMEKLQNLLAEKEAEVERLKAVPTADDFVRQFVDQSMKFFKRNSEKIDGIRQILLSLDQQDAANVLDDWMERRENPTTITNNYNAPVGQLFNHADNVLQTPRTQNNGKA